MPTSVGLTPSGNSTGGETTHFVPEYFNGFLERTQIKGCKTQRRQQGHVSARPATSLFLPKTLGEIGCPELDSARPDPNGVEIAAVKHLSLPIEEESGLGRRAQGRGSPHYSILLDVVPADHSLFGRQRGACGPASCQAIPRYARQPSLAVPAA